MVRMKKKYPDYPNILLFFLNLIAIFGMTTLHADWAEDILNKLSIEEKIGQLFVIPACQLRDEEHLADLRTLIQQHHIGGVILKQGSPEGQVALINRLQEMADVPLLCVQDAEWGLSMRLQDTIRFPRNLTLGAIQDKRLLYDLGKEIGRQCALVGVHINLAPVVDVNNNPKNPIIHMRSFGDDPEEVASRALLMMQGMQESGILPCAKHFPGHGNVTIDSHVDLPTSPELQLHPFQRMIQGGVSALMTAHILVPGFQGPVTFSKDLIQGSLQDFEGLILTDALNMKALTRHFSASDIALKALLAGHDLLLYGDHIAPNVDEILRSDVPLAIVALKQALIEGSLSEAELDRHVLKILKTKERLNLHQRHSLPPPTNLHTPEALALKRTLYQQALTLLRNDGILPLPPNTPVALLQTQDHPHFTENLTLSADADTLILITHDHIPPELKPHLQNKTVIHVHFGSPYTLDPSSASAILLAYEDDPDAQKSALDALLGTFTPQGTLPIKDVSP
jgi:beta-N-acetylhexosaminidase